MAATVAPAQRGSLRIADRVLTRIAARAARQALADVWRGEHTPSVSLAGTRLTVGVELPFPADLAALAGAVQAAVREQVTGLTGRKVDDVTVVVERLVPAPAAEL